MSEIEKMMQNANVAKPVIKKWCYDGYYEDFNWQSSEEDCTELLKYFNNSINKLNDRIQQMKKEENAKYDRYTDSVDTEFGRIEKAYIDYPLFTAEKQLALIIFLANREIRISPTYMSNGYYLNNLNKITSSRNVSTFENSLAQHINAIWQDLTEEEKQQVKGILE